jgi:biopolymer transport protein ExbD
MAGGASSDDDDGMISAINITPMVDVVLVLLVIFMVTARIIHAQGMPMDLPKAASGESIQTVFSVELSADGKTFVDSEQVASDAAISKLAEASKLKNPEIRAVIRADQKVEHGRVIHVLDLLKRAGVAKIAFAVAPADGPVPEGQKPATTETPVETEKK